MKVTALNNLWVGYNEKENFRILICADDIADIIGTKNLNERNNLLC